MKKNLAIKVQNLGKKYKIGKSKKYLTLRDSLVNFIQKPFSQSETEEIWALKNVSFEVKKGEVLGIIGANGAGKSTLLKILTQITKPTTGKIKLCGRVSSLLEVGTGFHSELTGRENIYMNGSILGMTKKEIEEKFDEIVDFSGLKKFLDTPVKRYSSGMRVRLAFSVAAHLEPEILLIDEVLAVGDAEFQKKCLGKMEDVSQQAGRTVLFVSHNMIAVRNLCKKVIWLEKGKIRQIGNAEAVTNTYYQENIKYNDFKEWSKDDQPGNKQVKIKSIAIKTENNTKNITTNTPIKIEIKYKNLVEDNPLTITLHLLSKGVVAFTTNSKNNKNWQHKKLPKGTYVSTCYIPENLLNNNTYSLNLLFIKNLSKTIFILENIINFKVIESANVERKWFGKRQGVVRPMLKWKTKKLSKKDEK